MDRLKPLVCVGLICLAVCVPADISQWEALPLNGGTVTCGIAIDPNDPDHLFAIVKWTEWSGSRSPDLQYDTPYALVESTDAGDSWREVAEIDWNEEILPGSHESLSLPSHYLHYLDNETIYAGRIRSFDNGETWEEFDPPGWITAVDPNDPEILFASRVANQYAPASEHPILFRSVNGGDDWTTMRLPMTGTAGLIAPPNVLISTANPSIILAYITGDHFEDLAQQGVWRSADGGDNWTQVLARDYPGGPAQACVLWEVAGSPSSFLTKINTSEGSRLYRSDDWGQNWTALPLPEWTAYPIPDDERANLHACFPHPTQAGRIYAILSHYSWDTRHRNYWFCRSDNGGQSFYDVAPLWENKSGTYCGAIDDTATEDAIYLGHIRHGLGKSADGGQTWASANNGVRYHIVTKIVEDPLDEDFVFACGTWGISRARIRPPSQVLVETVSEEDQIIDMCFCRDAPTRGGATSWSRQYVTADAGRTWEKENSSVGIASSIVATPTTPTLLLIGSSSGLKQVEPGGGTWLLLPGIIINRLDWGTLPGGSPDNIATYAGAKDFIFGSNQSGVFRSDGDWVSWTTAGLSTLKIDALAVDPENGERVYAAGTDEGNVRMYVTFDGGLNWAEITPPYIMPSEIRDIEIAPDNPDHVYVAVRTAIYRSSDAGQTWSVFSEGLRNVHTIHVAKNSDQPLAPSPVSVEPTEQVYVGTNGGLFRFTGNETRARQWLRYW